MAKLAANKMCFVFNNNKPTVRVTNNRVAVVAILCHDWSALLATVLYGVVRLWSGYCGPGGVSLQIRDNRNKFSTQHANPRVANVHVNPSQSKFVTLWVTSMGMSSLPPLRSSPDRMLSEPIGI